MFKFLRILLWYCGIRNHYNRSCRHRLVQTGRGLTYDVLGCVDCGLELYDDGSPWHEAMRQASSRMPETSENLERYRVRSDEFNQNPDWIWEGSMEIWIARFCVVGLWWAFTMCHVLLAAVTGNELLRLHVQENLEEWRDRNTDLLQADQLARMAQISHFCEHTWNGISRCRSECSIRSS